MKKMPHLATAAILGTVVPALSFAQVPQESVAQVKVRAELIRLENAGYRSGPGESNYPADLQAAEAKIAAQQGIEAPKAPLSRGTVRQ